MVNILNILKRKPKDSTPPVSGYVSVEVEQCKNCYSSSKKFTVQSLKSGLCKECYDKRSDKRRRRRPSKYDKSRA